MKYWSFSILDEPENIQNASEIIENCVYADIIVISASSFFVKDDNYLDRIKQLPLFAYGTVARIRVFLPTSTIIKMINKKECIKEYNYTLLKSSVGIQLYTIKEVNEIINEALNDN